MIKKLLCLFFIAFGFFASAQIVGTIKNTKNEPLPFVNILIENTYKGTTSNDDGYYELNITKPKTYTIVYTYLGYKTVKKKVAIDKFPYEINITLEEESVSLGEDRRILASGAESWHILTLTEHPVFTPEKESFRAP